MPIRAIKPCAMTLRADDWLDAHAHRQIRALRFVGTPDYCVDNYEQYLAKNPFGYRCHANTGVSFPD
jgi:hypothetical protein